MVKAEDESQQGIDAAGVDQDQAAAWQRYHEDKEVQAFAYSFNGGHRGLVDRLVEFDPHLLNVSQPRTFLLAGFHPNNGTPTEFLEVARSLHPHDGDVHIYMDMSETALKGVPKAESVRTALSTLEEMDFEPDSLDFVFVDFTTEFMSDAQVRGFAERAAVQLSRQGVLLLAKRPKERGLIIAEKNPLPAHFARSANEMFRLMRGLRPIAATESTTGEHYIAFARRDSDYPSLTKSRRII